jgi:hypothetical protein
LSIERNLTFNFVATRLSIEIEEGSFGISLLVSLLIDSVISFLICALMPGRSGGGSCETKAEYIFSVTSIVGLLSKNAWKWYCRVRPIGSRQLDCDAQSRYAP